MANGMSSDWIDRLRDSVDIVDVVGDYVSLRPKGHRHWACCPFHNEKTPSFEVDSRSQMFYCFGCHKGGNVFNFVMEMEHMEFMDAARLLADRVNFEIPEMVHIKSLHYTADNGTDFTVGMIDQAQFCGGGETSLQNIFFNPNIPTEECFISPKRGEAEGIVYATKPLSYQGQLIENFSIRFHEGKAVEVHAEKGEELLKTMISMDEGAAYLGECALVPQASPIAQSGILFYNTLFDENAACHLALGMGFADTIKDFHNKTLDECRALGVNDSMIHEDFMIGCDSMNIDAVCADGRVVSIFRGGNWAF